MGETRTKKTEKNIIYSAILQFSKIALAYIGRVIFVRQLSASYLGVNGLFSNILGVLSLADLGMTTVLMYSLYKPLAEKDNEKIKQYMHFFKIVYNIIAILVAVVGIALIPFLKYLVNLPTDMPDIYLYYILMLASSVMSYLFVYKTTLVSADQKLYLINKYDTIFQFVLFFVQMIILFTTKNYALYLLANVVIQLISNLVKVHKTEKIYPFLKEKKVKPLEKKEKKSILNNLKSLFFYKIGGVLQNNTDNILISIFVGTIVVGYYSNYLTIISSITTFLTLVFTSVKASIGNYTVLENKEDQLNMFYILETFNYWLVSFCAICFIVLIPDFINISFGEEYVLGNGLLIFATLNFYTSNIRQVIWAYREATGIFSKTKYITLITSALNIILSIILGKICGLVGIIAATVIARMVYAWWKEPTILFGDYFKMSPKKYYIDYIKRIILTAGIAGVIFIVSQNIPINNIYILFIVKALLCCIIPTVIFYLIYRKSEAFKYLDEKILTKLKRGKNG